MTDMRPRNGNYNYSAIGDYGQAERSPVERFVMRFNDVYLDILHKTLTDIFAKAIPVKMIIEDGNVKYIYSNETQEQIDYFKEEMIKRHCELAKPLNLIGA